MRFLIDECLHDSPVNVAHAAGLEAMHVNHLGLSGRPDWALAERIVEDEFTFVTNNRADLIELFGKIVIHPGLIVLVPNIVPILQRQRPEQAATSHSNPAPACAIDAQTLHHRRS
jgi:predicted nuclease of predicted toxin-antitoxin system